MEQNQWIQELIKGLNKKMIARVVVIFFVHDSLLLNSFKIWNCHYGFDFSFSLNRPVKRGVKNMRRNPCSISACNSFNRVSL